MSDQQLALSQSDREEVESASRDPAFMKIYLTERERLSHDMALSAARRQFFAAWC